MNEANKIREVVPDLQTMLNGCHHSVAEIEHKIRRLGSNLHGTEDVVGEPDGPTPSLTPIQQLEHDVNYLADRLAKVDKNLGGYLSDLLGKE